MPAKHITFSIDIDAPVDRVWQTMLDPAAYREWTRPFCEGSYFEGSWDQGARIRFLAPNGDGMVSEIAENRLHEFISIRHLGIIAGGVEDTTSPAAAAWAPAYENYTFQPTPTGTRLLIDQDMVPEYEQFMTETWPRALEVLKGLCTAAT